MILLKLEQVDLGSPRRELSNGGLEIVVALLVHWKKMSARIGHPIHL